MYVFFQSFFYPLLFVDINSSEKIKKDRNRRGRGEEKSVFLRKLFTDYGLRFETSIPYPFDSFRKDADGECFLRNKLFVFVCGSYLIEITAQLVKCRIDK